MTQLIDKEFVLHSPYNPVTSMQFTNLADCLLQKAKENSANGRDQWIVTY